MIFTLRHHEYENEKWKNDFTLDEFGSSYDRFYSKAYVRHLFVSKELPLLMQIASIHNLVFYLWLVGEARTHIQHGDFSSWKRRWYHNLKTTVTSC